MQKQSSEAFINDLSKELADVWYCSEDWGQDAFTETMCEEVTSEQADYRNKVFEASMYHVAQTLVYGGLSKETREKIISHLQQQKGM